MPNTSAAKKALRQNARRKVENLQTKRALKGQLKHVDRLIKSKQVSEARELLPKTYKVIDKAAKKGIMKLNTASRAKSKVARQVANSEK